MANLDEREGERTGLYSGEIDHGITEAGGGHHVPNAFAEWLGDGAQRSAAGSSIRAMSSWWRTRRSVNPIRRRPASTCSIWLNLRGVTG